MTPPLADLSRSIHELAGRSSALDSVMSFLAQDIIDVAVLAFVVLWFRRDGLRAGLAAGLGALLALVISIGAVCAVIVWYGLHPVMPVIDRLDAELQRRRLRPGGRSICRA